MSDAPGPAAEGPLLRTPLLDFHRRHGAKLVPFSGWEMPLHYGSILSEHRAVRRAVGLFDVGHMGILTVDGPHAAPLLSRRTTANAEKIAPGQVRYTFFLEASGGIVDDLLITRLDRGDGPHPSFLAVPNAGRAAEIELILRQHRLPDVEIRRWNGPLTIVAVQGPASRALLEREFGWSLGALPFYHGRFFPSPSGAGGDREGTVGGRIPDDLGPSWFVSRTGYTGELGFELFVPGPEADAIAERIVRAGALPCGLGARDSLRLEKGYLLSGSEFHRDHTPLEAGQGRFVEFDHPFVGRDVLEPQKAEGPPVLLSGLRVVDGPAVPRHGTPVLQGGAMVAAVTSGGLSPTLGIGIALAYLPKALAKPGTRLDLDLRGGRAPIEVVPLPFVAATRSPG